MSKRWKVNDWFQVAVGDKVHVGGETFTATDAELDEAGGRGFVSEVRQQSQPKAENKAQAAPEPQAKRDSK